MLPCRPLRGAVPGRLELLVLHVGDLLGAQRPQPGREEALAITVGTTADATTAVTSSVNWRRSMIPACNPNREEIVPKVSPVLISRVVNVECGRT
jgi:hypothetical protein